MTERAGKKAFPNLNVLARSKTVRPIHLYIEGWLNKRIERGEVAYRDFAHL